MKKLTRSFLALAALLTLSQAQAQSDTTATTKPKYLNVGIGVAAYTAGGIPIGASFEVGIRENISVGGFVDYARYGHRYGGYKWNYNFLYFGARASYQLKEILEDLQLSSRFDPYAGVSVGVRTVSYSDNLGNDTHNNDYNPYSSGMFMGIHAGSRYYFNEKLGAFAEVGYGVSAFKLGITATF